MITGPAGDACMFVSTQLPYRVGQPNRKFFFDVAAQCMRGKRERCVYDGRDSEGQEAFDYEVAGALARVCGAVRMMEGQDAGRVARMLRDCSERVEAVGQASARSEGMIAQMPKSTRPVRRATSALLRDRGLRPVIVTVVGSVIELRAKGLRTTETMWRGATALP